MVNLRWVLRQVWSVVMLAGVLLTIAALVALLTASVAVGWQGGLAIASVFGG